MLEPEYDSEASDEFDLDLRSHPTGEDRDDLNCSTAEPVRVCNEISDGEHVYNWNICNTAFSLPAPPFKRHPGITYSGTGMTEIDYFQKMFGASAISQICKQSTMYARQSGLDVEMRENDLLRFLAIQIYMGINRKPDASSHWRTHWLDHNSHIGKILTKTKYWKLSRILHFNDNASQPALGTSNHDPLYKVRPLLQLVDTNFWVHYTPERELSIDESMIGFKGRVSFLQYIPSKRTRFGVKCWVLAEARTGYVLRFFIYTGSNPNVPKTDGLGSSVVMQLVAGLHQSNHIIYMDNFYSSPKLFMKLKSSGLGACGTLRFGRKGLPVDISKKNWTLKRGEEPIFYKSDCGLLLCAWMDKKPVAILSSAHDTEIVTKNVRSKDPARRIVCKPSVINTYNKHMGGVDLGDIQMHFYSFPHGEKKWYKRVYHQIIEQCLLNACISYNNFNFDKPITSLQFRRHLIDQLLAAANLYDPHWTHPCLQPVTSDTTIPPISARFTGRHYLKPVPVKKDCICCSSNQRRVRVSTVCKVCMVYLCVFPCHEKFHEEVNYKWIRTEPKAQRGRVGNSIENIIE